MKEIERTHYELGRLIMLSYFWGKITGNNIVKIRKYECELMEEYHNLLNPLEAEIKELKDNIHRILEEERSKPISSFPKELSAPTENKKED